jgi:hypothetical protein
MVNGQIGRDLPVPNSSSIPNVSCLRLQDSYQGIVYLWIHFTNPWIGIVSWPWIRTPKRFNSCLTIPITDLYHILDHKSGLKKIHIELWIMNPANFQRFNLFSRIQHILMNPDEALVHRHTMNRMNSYKSLGFGFANLHGFPITLGVSICLDVISIETLISTPKK